jgi:uncharacterized protein (DUF983 family)
MSTNQQPAISPPFEPRLPDARTIFSRALRLRCPVCGGRPIFLSWFTVCSSCPHCGFHLDRDEPGYWIGSYTVNLFATEGVWVAFFVVGMFITWPEVPWSALLYAGLAVGILTPVLLFPHTKTLYLAIDLCFRPPEPADLVVPMERGFALPQGKGGRTPSPPA